MSRIDYKRVTTVEEVMLLCLQQKEFRFVAGGTDYFVNKQQGNIEAGLVVDVSGIKSLIGIQEEDGKVLIGALTTLETIVNSSLISENWPALSLAASSVATPVIRKSATIGGNLLCENRCSFYNQSAWWREAVGYCLKCNGDVCIATGGKKNCFSKFVSDTAPVLISLRAEICVLDRQGELWIPLEKLYSGDGVNPLTISKQSLIKQIRIPISGQKSAFRKLRPRKTLDFTSLSTAVTLESSNHLRIVVGGVDPRPVLVEGSLDNNRVDVLRLTASKKPRVVDNDFYSRIYRKEMIAVFLQQCLIELGLLQNIE